MLTEHQKNMLIEETKAYWEIARQIYPDAIKHARLHERDCPVVDFKIRGATAGRARLYHWGIGYNAAIAERHFVRFMDRTVPHEVAHFVAWIVFGDAGHRAGWKRVMHDFGVEDNSRCHSYDLTGIVTRHQRFPYHCACQTHQLTKRKASSGRIYTCVRCKARLSPGEFKERITADRSSNDCT